jgi:succinate-acetate transporter protein
VSTVAPANRTGNGAVAEDPGMWRSQTRVFLTPIAAPSILGLFGFAGATFMVAANMAGWFGNATSGVFIFPFALTFGGIAQFLAGMWSYRARDGIATAMHGTWGAFWIAYGILWGFQAAHALTLPSAVFPAFGYWFIVLATITTCGFFASLFESVGLAAVLFTLATGSALAVPFFLTGSTGWEHAAGWAFLVSSWCAVYTAFAMMLEGAAGRVILPLGRVKRHARPANIPGHIDHIPLQFEYGEPGVRHGQ